MKKLNELDYIKKAESGVARKIGLAEKRAEKSVKKALSERGAMLDQKLSSVRERLEEDMRKGRTGAGREAEKMIKASAVTLGEIEDSAKKRSRSAVNMVLRSLTYVRT